ncbi:2-phospho-L-lactate guanylyltransferase [Gordonia sp. 'Campus']|uniref:2-phospho-L-lactate guanylyltransferase n=1 Tax=Gordonia sp. 'Campus' TaxID=2915824 RepID=UPI001EE3B72D|nr:2-phospho-L-lactate guanylyltransferase [Gordonia sp. 'Campus']
MEHGSVDVNVDSADVGQTDVDAVDADAVEAASVEDQSAASTVAAVLAVKSLHRAKSRLAATLSTVPAGDDPTTHGSLVLGMFLDTIEALRGAGVVRVVVVSPDDEVLAAARRAGMQGLRESPVSGSATAGLNAAFADGARWARQTWPDSSRLMFVQADLPAATSRSVGEVVRAARVHPSSFLSDRDGTGTVILHGSTDDAGAVPRFGPASAAAHRAAGAVELDPARHRWADLRTDVDTAADLAVARGLGLGRHTTEALRNL